MSRITNLITDFFAMCKKYPLVILGMLIIVSLGIYTNHRYDYNDSDYFEIFFKLQISIGIGIPLILASYLYYYDNNIKKYISQIIIVAISILYYYYLSQGFHSMTGIFAITNIIIWIVALSLLFISHRKQAKENDNKLRYADSTMISSAVIAIFFTGVLCLGIAGVFGSLEYLFDVNIQWDYMTDIAMIIMGIGGISLFLKRISTEHTITYPKLLELFAKYILASLVGIYALILIAYGIKIISTGVRPKGEVVYMTMGYFALGFLTTLCFYPLSNDTTHRRVRIFNLGFYITSLPILFLGFMSLYLRVDQYGWTINRYLVVALLLFFASLGIYNIIVKKYKTIGLFGLLILFGLSVLAPVIGFKDVIRTYQTNKLHNLVTENKLLDTDNQFIKDNNLTGIAKQSLYSIIDYLGETFSSSDIKKLAIYNSGLVQIVSGIDNAYDQKENLKNAFGLSGYNGNYNGYTEYPTINRYSDNNDQSIDIGGYTQLFVINHYEGSKQIPSEAKDIKIANTTTGVSFTRDNKNNTISFDTILNNGAITFDPKGNNDPDYTVTLTGKNYKALIKEFNASKDSQRKVSHYKMYLLVK